MSIGSNNVFIITFMAISQYRVQSVSDNLKKTGVETIPNHIKSNKSELLLFNYSSV